MDIKGKKAVITGGGSGMGASTAQHLSRLGAKVAVIDRDEEMAKKVASEIDGLAVQCDVSDESQAERALQKIAKEFGNIHICVNCAGIAPAKRIVGREGAMPLSEFQKVISVNLIGTFNILRLAAAMMINNEPIGPDQERGVIINTASVAAYDGQIGQSAYSASKGAVCSLTLPAARELAQFNIRVMTIAPGLIHTPLLESLPEEVQARIAETIPFPHRFGQAKEFAMLVAHIIDNPYLNGEVIRLDAALRMQPK